MPVGWVVKSGESELNSNSDDRNGNKNVRSPCSVIGIRSKNQEQAKLTGENNTVEVQDKGSSCGLLATPLHSPIREELIRQVLLLRRTKVTDTDTSGTDGE